MVDEVKREFFCCGCGLFHWGDQYVTDPDTGRIDWNPKASECPNLDCISKTRDDVGHFAVDTFGWAYFCESDVGKEVLKKKWSSPKYAPEDAIELYRKHGVKIEE